MDIKLITCIVERGKADQAVKAATKAGAQGATIFYARGTGIRQKLGFIQGIIKAEKEVVMIAVKSENTDTVYNALIEAAGLDKPGKGFAFVHTIEKAIGFLDKQA